MSEGFAQGTGARRVVALGAWLAELELPDLVTLDIDAIYFERSEFRSPLHYVIRSLLGARLRRQSCLTGAPDCSGCTVRSRCDYARLFGSEEEPRTAPGGFADLQPFWLRGIPCHRSLDVGFTLRARMSMLALDEHDVGVLEVALRAALASLGRGVRGGLQPWLSETRAFAKPLTVTSVRSDTWWLEARTPLLLSQPQRTARLPPCPAAPWLPDLMAAGVRRLRALAAVAGREDHAVIEFPALGDVEILAGGLRPWSGKVSSRRQERSYLVRDGRMGGVLLRGTGLVEAGPLLGCLAETGVGKKTAMGFGDFFAATSHEGA